MIKLKQKIIKKFANINTVDCWYDPKITDELTIEVTSSEHLLSILSYLQQDTDINLQALVDLCVVDYLDYGIGEQHVKQGASAELSHRNDEVRFVVVYHLLSILKNHRVRVKYYLSLADNLSLPSCTSIWGNANWYEREAFDLFGIKFIGHPNLDRLLLENDFRGHPLRKDFPISGNLEARFDAKLQKVVYEPIDIEPYNVVPKVIRREKNIQFDQEPVT